MFRSVLDVPAMAGKSGSLSTTSSTMLTILSLGSYWSVVKMKDGGRDWDVVDCWFLIYLWERGGHVAYGVCVCTCVGVNAMERKPVVHLCSSFYRTVVPVPTCSLNYTIKETKNGLF